jgi:hypothetical protein
VVLCLVLLILIIPAIDKQVLHPQLAPRFLQGSFRQLAYPDMLLIGELLVRQQHIQQAAMTEAFILPAP